MTGRTFDWRSFLARWSEEWAGACTDPGELREGDEEAWRARWLGFDAAPAERVAAVQAELGWVLPPSYREFLAVSDGWRHAGGFVYRLAGAGDARWHRDARGLSEYFDEGETEGLWQRALQLDVESDATLVLLDPGDVDAEGEWAVYCYASWRAAPPERYPSFRAFMVAMHQEFHRLAAHRCAASFVNATTREQDARVEAARLDALTGAYERAAEALAEAVAYGRPRAAGMLDQLRGFGRHRSEPTFGELPRDPAFLGEVIPVLAVHHARRGRDATAWGYTLRVDTGELRAAADEVLRQVREREYRYTAAGPFGEAVERAREQARWGGTEAAWRTLRAALPRWAPVGPDHLAPVGLLADPLLGPLLTAERGLELLATPRGLPDAEVGERAAAEPEAVGDGLAWLALEPRSGRPRPYRFVLVEGVAPEELPAVLAGEGAVLDPPATRWEAGTDRLRERTVFSSEDPQPALVGHAGGDGGAGWSFAFEARTSPVALGATGAVGLAGSVAPRVAAPAVTASGRTGGRALAVFVEPEAGFFHLSVADGGAERYGFTVRGPEIGRRGTTEVPPALDPDRHFGPHAHGRQGEYGLLTALASEFGVALPRFALTEGRLHTFADPSWAPPRLPGEAYSTARMVLTEPHPTSDAREEALSALRLRLAGGVSGVSGVAGGAVGVSGVPGGPMKGLSGVS
ncbi:SMI1/KNR4 family protein [Kitasatospora sp. NPDC004723]|uniref:SMI1/KNR4 family protein n=1 Tax=Kitasatospora sp. NPDC004723 TaxID=3154288 RepID=UPI0033B959A5